MVEAAWGPLTGSQKVHSHSYYSSRTRERAATLGKVIITSVVGCGGWGSRTKDASKGAQSYPTYRPRYEYNVERNRTPGLSREQETTGESL